MSLKWSDFRPTARPPREKLVSSRFHQHRKLLEVRATQERRSDAEVQANNRKQPAKYRKRFGISKKPQHGSQSLSLDIFTKGNNVQGKTPGLQHACKAAPPSREERNLNKALNACTDPEQILSLVAKYIETDIFSTINAATAFYKIAKTAECMSPYAKAKIRSDSRTQQLARSLEERWQSWGGFATSNIIWAHVSVGHGSDSLPSKVEQRMLQILPEMTLVEISGVLPGLLEANQLSSMTFQRLREPLIHLIRAQGGLVKERFISSVLRVYAKAERHTTAEDVRVLQELVNATWLVLKQPNHSPRGLACLLWGFGKLKLQDAALFDALAEACLNILDPRKRLKINPRDLSQMSWGLGKGYSANISLPEQYARPDSWILDFMRAKPIRYMVFKALAFRIRMFGSNIENRSLVVFLNGCASVLYRDFRSLQGICEVMGPQCPTYSDQDVAVAMKSLSTLRYDDPIVFELLAERLSTIACSHSEELTEQAVTMFVHACADLDLRHLPGCMKACREMAAYVGNHIEEFDRTQSLANVAFALTVLDILEPSLFRQICLAMAKLEGPFQQELPQIYQANLALALKSPGSTPHSRKSATNISDFLQECFDLGELKMASQVHWKNLLKNSFRNISALQRNVAQMLDSLGATYCLEFDGEDYSVDIALPEQKIAIEVDGPHHFTQTMRPLGYSVLKSRLLQQQGWRVLSVAYYEWNSMSTEQNKRDFLEARLLELGWSPPSPLALEMGSTGIAPTNSVVGSQAVIGQCLEQSESSDPPGLSKHKFSSEDTSSDVASEVRKEDPSLGPVLLERTAKRSSQQFNSLANQDLAAPLYRTHVSSDGRIDSNADTQQDVSAASLRTEQDEHEAEPAQDCGPASKSSGERFLGSEPIAAGNPVSVLSSKDGLEDEVNIQSGFCEESRGLTDDTESNAARASAVLHLLKQRQVSSGRRPLTKQGLLIQTSRLIKAK